MIQIVGVKEANIEVVEVPTAPEGTPEGIVLDQSPKLGESVDLNTTRIKISIYKPKTTTTTTTVPSQNSTNRVDTAPQTTQSPQNPSENQNVGN